MFLFKKIIPGKLYRNWNDTGETSSRLNNVVEAGTIALGSNLPKKELEKHF